MVTLARSLAALLACAGAATAQIEAGIIGGMIGGLAPLQISSEAYSPPTLTLDASRLDLPALDRLAARLGAERTDWYSDRFCWERPMGIGPDSVSFLLSMPGVEWMPTEEVVDDTTPAPTQ